MATSQQPTKAELQVLQVLWQKGASTVREVHEILSKYQKTGYTTVLKIMQIMYDKSLVDRDESARAHVYSAKITEADTQGVMVRDMISRVFKGSTSQMLVSALNGKTSRQEIAEIRKVLNELENNNK
ncbi:BlaI/MecI/CopY family transcriptional regulator [Aliikangiella sp. G2MR2-5]|uniref:BlaI/MecI/CopY family transcriptional regulator n=1 Tax=Aliikangiella sp. G2MR2-5 TaxID=2788943 RepID=UPI0018A93446|nr:BlaI/MecI/CopY family transcriptional regulator [Aliikangiella sp. G2MR2-5]